MKKAIFVTLIILCFFMTLPRGFSFDVEKSFTTSGYTFTGAFGTYYSVDFYLYEYTDTDFVFRMTNLDYPLNHTFRIKDEYLQIWVRGTFNNYVNVTELPRDKWLRLRVEYQWDSYVEFSLAYADTDVAFYTATDFYTYCDGIEGFWSDKGIVSGYVGVVFPHLGVDGNGHMRFEILANEGSIALSRVYIESSARWFTWVKNTHLDDKFDDANHTVLWDIFDTSGFNSSLVTLDTDHILKIWGNYEPTNPVNLEELPWWQQLQAQIWSNLVQNWNIFTSAVGNLLPTNLQAFFNWLWVGLNWIWSMIVVTFDAVTQFAPILGFIVVISFIGEIFVCIQSGNIDPLKDQIFWFYEMVSGLISGLASVASTIWDFIKVW